MPSMLGGYDLQGRLHDGEETVVYRGYRLSDQRPIVAKILRREMHTERALTRFQLGFDIGARVASPGVIEHITLDRVGGELAIIMEDYGAESLDRLMAMSRLPLDLGELLHVAVSLAEALASVHAHQVVHKDIKPHNIVYHPKTRLLKLIDFGIASQLSREMPALASVGRLEGSLVYISPEQTGRMNRAIDMRSDLYSVGVTLYQLFTGRLPFDSFDPLELVHCHLARKPRPAIEVAPDVPQVVSDIFDRLLAKMAEERYQTAVGLHHDLKESLRRYHGTVRVDRFSIGEHDNSDRFEIPQRLYGREAESARILAAFERASQGSRELFLVAGYSGIGKSALIQEVHKPIVKHRGYFCSGKFDQFRRDLPYRAIIEALRDLLRQVLTENDDAIAGHRARLNEALGVNGRVIADVVPELELICGEQPAVGELAPAETRNRFNRVFMHFLRVFATAEHPLAIVLDDLQWADLPSLQLMTVLVTDPNQRHLFLVGAYRDNEVSEAHPLMQTLAQIEEAGQRVEKITLAPLELPTVIDLVSDTVHCARDDAATLAELVHNKTRGNPFFVGEFLNTLYRQGHLSFEPTFGRWCWAMENIQRLDITDNVVELVAAQLEGLPAPTLAVLKVAACCGSRFDLRTIALAHGKDRGATATDLALALQEGLVLPGDEHYKYMEALAALKESGQEARDSGSGNAWYRFLHDRVHQAAYSLLDAQERRQTHLRMGRLLRSHLSESDAEEQLMDIANHFLMARDLVVAPEEKRSMAQLCLAAGERAKASLAVEPAASYLETGIGLLSSAAWDDDYALALQLYTVSAEAEFLSGNYDAMDMRIAEVRAHARDVLDEVAVWDVLIQANTARNESQEAIYNALDILAKLGVRLPRNPTQAHIIAGVAAAKLAVARRAPMALAKLPDMSDQKIKAAMGILMTMVPAAFFYAPAMFPVITFRMVRLSCKYGNTNNSAYGYVVYGMILCGVLGQFDRGYAFGKLAFELMDKFNARELRGKVLFAYHAYIRHWKEPLHHSREALLDAWRAGVDVGDNEYAAYAINLGFPYGLLIGMALPELHAVYSDYIRWIHHSNQETPIALISSWEQLLLNLSQEGPTINKELTGEHFDVHQRMPKLLEGQHFKAAAYASIAAGIQAYLYGDCTRALPHFERAQKLADAVMAAFYVPTMVFYHALTLAALARREKQGSSRRLRQVARKMRKMRKWARFSPSNHHHKVSLLHAEWLRAKGKLTKAMPYYQAAIAGAREGGFLHEEALATERLSEAMRAHGLGDIADFYIRLARDCYERWGGFAKVTDLETVYANTLNTPGLESVSSSWSSRDFVSRAASGSWPKHFTDATPRPGVRSGSWRTRDSAAHSGNHRAFGAHNSGSWKAREREMADNRSLPWSASVTVSTSSMRASPEYASLIDEPLAQQVVNTWDVDSALNLVSVIRVSRALSSEIEIGRLKTRLMRLVIENAGAEIGKLLLMDHRGDLRVEAIGSLEQDRAIATDISAEEQTYPRSIIDFVARTEQAIVLPDARQDGLFGADPYILKTKPLSVLAAPLLLQGKLTGILYLENNLGTQMFTQDRLNVLETLCAQAAISIENSRLFTEQKKQAESFARFVPQQFLQNLGRRRIIDVELGDSIVRDITVLFSDLRGFTSLSEKMTVQENFDFLNAYLAQMQPCVEAAGGFIDKFIGDAVMALFPGEPSDALRAGVAMHHALDAFNAEQPAGRPKLIMGIGIHTGPLMLGTIGSSNRMETTVIGDSVNLAARIEGATKMYRTRMLVTAQVLQSLDTKMFQQRSIGRIRVKGKTEHVDVFELLNAESKALRDQKVSTLNDFERAIRAYFNGDFTAAHTLFESCAARVPNDATAAMYAERCRHYIEQGGPDEGWDGIETLVNK